MLSNEWIFYMGIVITGCTLLVGIVYMKLSKRWEKKLLHQLESEYGEKPGQMKRYRLERETAYDRDNSVDI